MDYTFLEIETNFNEPYSTMRSSAVTQTTEVNSGEDLVILDGYVDYKKSIQDMIIAGENLANSRLYDDNEALSNEDYAERIAILRHPNTDIVDVQNYTDYINEKLASAKSTAQRKQYENDIDPNNVYSSREKKEPLPEEPDQGTNPPPQQTNSKSSKSTTSI